MAEKRTTQETPPGAQPEAPHEEAPSPRRKKLAAPTIDLTATEMPPQSEPPLASAQEPPPGGPEPPPGNAPVGERLEGKIGAAALAGVAGGAIVTLALFALWLTGLLPVRYAASTDTDAQVAALQAQVSELKSRPAGDSNALDALSQRVSKIEEVVSRLPVSDAGMAERLAAADNAVKSLGIALAALNGRSDEIAASANQARERAEATAKTVAELSASVQDAAKNSSARISAVELDALRSRIAALEQSAQAAREDIVKASSTDVAARLAVSAAALRDVALGGAPFAAELAQVKSLGADDKALAPLDSFAAAGVPTAQALARELHALLPVMLKVSGAHAPEGSFLERLQANAGKLVRIRPVDAPPRDDPSAVLAQIEVDAGRADIPATLADLGKLADASRAPAQAWIEKANARQAALAAARQFAADTARAIGSR